jgi:hypothetical protein
MRSSKFQPARKSTRPRLLQSLTATAAFLLAGIGVSLSRPLDAAALEGSTIRNLRIIAQQYTGVVAMGAHSFSICRSEITSYVDVNAGLDFLVTDGAASTLTVVDTTLDCIHGCGATGIQVRGDSPVPPGPVTVDLRNWDVYYYWIGLYYSTDESEPQVTLYADCKDFHDNDTNVQVCNHDCVEMCPAPP